jgi:DNA-binding NtrC family response regulator
MTRVTVANLIGRSAVFQETVRLVQRIAQTDAPVLIEGETGTGKEVAARAIHCSGVRRDRPFVPVNCGAIRDNLIENALFGQVRGANTDARGLIALANGGTLFLDEVEQLCPKGQVALLRFLQDLDYRPLGSRYQESADVRVIAATNVNLSELVQAKQFRMDLYYRLQILFLRMPPLRERDGDPALLAEHFARAFSARYGGPASRFGADSLALLGGYAWPGNVRELENLVHRAFLLAGGDVISIPNDWLVNEPRPAAAGAHQIFPLDLAFSEAKARLIDQFERVYIAHVLSQTNGNVSQAARRCGKERRAFGKLLKKHGIDRRLFLA